MAGDADNEPDESLMARIQKGDHRAFAALVRRHSDKFYGLAYRMTGHVEEAEDIVQEAFLKLWNKPKAWSAKKGAKFTTWFYQVVTNTALDALRKKKSHSGSDVLEHIEDSKDSAEERVIKTEKEDLIEAAIHTLPERQKAALTLCFYEGVSNAEAAEILDVSVKALESLLSRAKAALRDDLTRQGVLQGVLKDKKNA